MVAPTCFLACRIFEDDSFNGQMRAVKEIEERYDLDLFKKKLKIFDGLRETMYVVDEKERKVVDGTKEKQVKWPEMVLPRKVCSYSLMTMTLPIERSKVGLFH